MLNQVILIGRLAQDPDMKTLDDGRKVAYINLAVQRPFKNMDGNYDTDFFRITVWEGLAVAIESYASKGVMVAIKARLQTWKYELNEEKRLTMIDIIAERITYLSQSSKAEIKQDEESSEK
ncbi:MAG: single-stranded DNA-binding protein [Acholeplasmataceae bacterium]|jgi:single-strand DNA-binding protein|nr:single-stranded DNA-binding protein [Acholeplasmataceae bacterium]